MNKKCPDCAEFKPHAHLEALNKTPPKTKEGEFLTIGLSGDISFANIAEGEMLAILDYCYQWSDRTFLIQSKNPAFFLNFVWPENVILGTTIETNRSHGINVPGGIEYSQISKAPPPKERYEAMKLIERRKIVTVEPILDFDPDIFFSWMVSLDPIVYIGYDSHPKTNMLPEPPLIKTLEFIHDLGEEGIEVREKLIRKEWWQA